MAIRIDREAARSVSGACMDLNVLYFAHVRAVTKKARESISIPDGARVSEAVAALVERYGALHPLMGAIRIAVNGEFVGMDTVLADGDELVLIPPVSGGSGVSKVALCEEALGPERLRQLEALVLRNSDGALVNFVGVVRNHARGREVTRLHYEAYASMAQRQMSRIVETVEADYPGVRVAVHHRTGTLEVGDVAVIVVATSPHRAEAFEACRSVIDRLKADVPIWKREIGPGGAEWVSDRP